MNLMHADIRVTDGIYAPLTSDEVKQLSNSVERDHNRQLSARLRRGAAVRFLYVHLGNARVMLHHVQGAVAE